MKIRLNQEIVMFNFLYFAFIMLFPFYLFSSGQPQISHMILIAIFGFVFWLMLPRFFDTIKENKTVMLFMIYIIYVNTSWLIITYNTSFITNTLFYIFNVLLFYSTYLLYSEKFISGKNIRTAIFFTLLLQFVFLASSGLDFNARNMLFFNNPNQLGYFAIAIVNIYFILGVNHEKTRDRAETIQNIIVYLLAFILVLFSSSKASLVSYLLILMLVFYVELIKRVTSWKLFISFIFGVALVVILFINIDTIMTMAENTALFNRTVNTGVESDDSLAGRGYDRIIQYVEYTLLGAGEGDFNRFTLSHHHGELHSTLANILFSYGMVGFAIFISFFINFRFYISKIFFYMSPILLYGLSHNGIRSPLFWIALALSLIYSKKENSVPIIQKIN